MTKKIACADCHRIFPTKELTWRENTQGPGEVLVCGECDAAEM